ncbi:unnamed protein product, partial [Didymodactylos carnosus]
MASSYQHVYNDPAIEYLSPPTLDKKNYNPYTYSHLHCKESSLPPILRFGPDINKYNRFRTISLVFTSDYLIVPSNYFQNLSKLFINTYVERIIDIKLRFTNFKRLTFKEYSLADLYDKKHLTKNLWLDIIPQRTNMTTLNSEEQENSTETIVQTSSPFEFDSNCWSGLSLSLFTLYIQTPTDRLSSNYPFEYLFNNTKIDELHITGSIIVPSPNISQTTFNGLIRTLKLRRRVDVIDSHEFPYYSQTIGVKSYTIEALGSSQMNLTDFQHYSNLRGLILIQPNFPVRIHVFLSALDTLVFDVERIYSTSLIGAKNINYLKLGNRLRTIDPFSFRPLHRLSRLDLYDVDLSQLTLDTRCILTEFIQDNKQHLLIIYPFTQITSYCECTQLFFDITRSKKLLSDENIVCAKRCRFSNCLIINQFFRIMIPLEIVKDKERNMKKNDDNDILIVDHDHRPDDIDFLEPVDIVTEILNTMQENLTLPVDKGTNSLKSIEQHINLVNST